MARQGAQVALRRDAFGKPADLVGRDGLAGEIGMARQEGLGLPLAFLGFERAGAIDQPPAGLEQACRLVEQAASEGRRACGCRPRSWSRPRPDGGGWCRWPSRAHRAGSRRRALRRAFPRRWRGSRPSGSGGRGFPRAAPGAWPSGRPRAPRRRPPRAARSCRRARRRDRRCARRACALQQAGGQGGGRILHPPFAVLVSRAARGSAVRSTRRMLPVGRSTPPRRSAQAAGIRLHRQIDGGHGAMRLGDLRGERLAVLRDPALLEPGRACRARDRRRPRIASRSRATRRRTALMKPPA